MSLIQTPESEAFARELLEALQQAAQLAQTGQATSFGLVVCHGDKGIMAINNINPANGSILELLGGLKVLEKHTVDRLQMNQVVPEPAVAMPEGGQA